MEFVFRTSIFLYVFMNTRYISVMQLKFFLDTSLTSPFMITYREKTKEESK